MNKSAFIKTSGCILLAFGLAACSGSDNNSIGGGGPTPPPGGGTPFGDQFDVVALTSSNKLITFNIPPFDPLAPALIAVNPAVTIAGLAAGDTPVGMDIRPATGELYLLTNNVGVGKLYTVTSAGAASPVATLDTALDGTVFAVDFNPVSDRLRVISADGGLQNLRVDPDTGAVTVDTPITDAGGFAPRIAAAAYSNSFSGGGPGSLSTALFGIDSTSDLLVRIGSEPATTGACPADTGNPNCGRANNVNTAFPFGDADDSVAFDIDGALGAGFAARTATGATSSELLEVDLGTGEVFLFGTIDGGETIKGLALTHVAAAVAFGVTETNKLLSFSPATPGTIATSVAITGLGNGETIRGIDFNPTGGTFDPTGGPLGGPVFNRDFSLDGQVLFALGSSGHIYTIDTVSAAATRFNSGASPAVFAGADFGFDFNPGSNRIRILSDTEENRLYNLDTGNFNTAGPALTPAGQIVATAYDRNVATFTGSTKYAIDSASDMLVIVGDKVSAPADDGMITNLGLLTVDASTCAGFDIAGGREGFALAALNVGGVSTSNLYQINLATGAATQVTTGAIGGSERVCSFSIRLK